MSTLCRMAYTLYSQSHPHSQNAISHRPPCSARSMSQLASLPGLYTVFAEPGNDAMLVNHDW